MSTEEKSSKSVSEILKDRILKVIEDDNQLPWMRPWFYRYAYNYWTDHQYTGINRWLLPVGEYMSAKQLQAYNKKNGTNYKFVKGIKWEYVLFMKECVVGVRKGELNADEIASIMGGGFIRHGTNLYYYDEKDGKLKKKYLVRKYYRVANIKYFQDENGNTPPSKIEGEESIVEFEYSEPEAIINNYCSLEGVQIMHDVHNEGYYRQSEDCVHVPAKTEFKSPEVYYSTVFHELVHSTGTPNRLDRESLRDYGLQRRIRSEEELIAEMGACLLCSEAGIHDITAEGESDYFTMVNSEAYIKSWYEWLKGTDIDLVSIASKAEKAYQYVMGVYSHQFEKEEDTVSVLK